MKTKEEATTTTITTRIIIENVNVYFRGVPKRTCLVTCFNIVSLFFVIIILKFLFS